MRLAGALGLVVLTSVFVKPAHAGYKPELQNAQKKIIRHWQNSFRALRTLDCQWQMKGNFMYQPSVQHKYDYKFLWNGARFRMDTTFSSTKPKQTGDYQSTIHVFDGKFYRNLNTIISGSRTFSLQSKPAQTVSPYNAVLPIINSFAFVIAGENFPFTIETLKNDAVWQNFEKRIQSIERGTWQQRSGFWLVVARTPKEQRQTKVFVDDKNLFPYFVKIIERRSLVGKPGYRDGTAEIQITRTMTWRAGSATYVFPLKSDARSWDKVVNGDSIQRSSTQTIEEATAPVKINQPVDAARFRLEIPAKTLVYFTPKPDTPPEDIYAFYYDPNGGSLWTQEQRERKRVDVEHKRIAALPKIYDEKADGKTQVANALAQAKTENKRVLLQFGANWCAPCHELHDLLEDNAQIAGVLQRGFVVVAIDLNEGRNADLDEQYRGPNQGGIPFIVVLDADGKRLAAPPYENLASSRDFDVTKIISFLNKWLPA
jgi:thiol-disulfide isomerase/thioredoxin